MQQLRPVVEMLTGVTAEMLDQPLMRIEIQEGTNIIAALA